MVEGGLGRAGRGSWSKSSLPSWHRLRPRGPSTPFGWRHTSLRMTELVRSADLLARGGALEQRNQLIGSGTVDGPGAARVGDSAKEEFAAAISVGIDGVD